MKLYALTGGIGAGKSAASQLFIERGIPVDEEIWKTVRAM